VLSSGEAAAQHRTFLFLPRPVKSVEHGKEYGMKGLHKIRGTYENHTSLILWDVA
jgi:hypothetical protein